MLSRLISIGIVLMCAGLCAHSQKVSEYKFAVLNTNNGLSHNTVADIVQDHKGFMWFATENGLQRYDGKRFHTFKNKPGNPQTIPNNMVEVLYEDKKQNLWIITADDRIGIFNTSYFTYREIAIPNQVKNDIIGYKTLVEDNNGNLYLSIHQQPKPFYQFSEKDQAFLPSALNNTIPAKWGLNHFFYDQYSSRFWAATDSGLVVHDPATRQTSYRGHNMANDPVIHKLGNERYTMLPYVDHQKNFWCVSSSILNGAPVVHRLEAGNSSYIKHGPFNNFRQVRDLVSQQSGRVWFCGRSFLLGFNKNARGALDTIAVNDNCNPKTLSFDIAGKIYEDREHTLWVATSQGVVRFTPDADFFSNYLLQKDKNSAPKEQITMAVCERKNGELWVGCLNTGLYTLGPDFSPITPKGNPAAQFPGKSIWSIHEHSLSGLIWMGYPKGQMGVYDPQSGKTELVTVPVLEGKMVHNMAEDQNGNLWFITKAFDTSANLVKWDRKLAGDDYRKGFVLVKRIDVTLMSIIVDKSNAVWVGTYGQGLQKFNAETNQMEAQILPEPADTKSILNNNTVFDIELYNDSLLITAGNVLGVVNTRTHAVRTYSKPDGLPGLPISVQRDKQGILWMGMMEAGICRFNMARNIFTVYTRDDGMLDDYFNAGARAKLSDGRFLFYTSRNIVAFNPNELLFNASAPAALLTDFKLLNISLPIDSLQKLARLTVPFDKNSVTIEFSVLSYASQNKINYYYQMEGLDKDWIAADETQRAMYNYLPAGKYTFRIKTDNGNSEKTAITSLQIAVRSAFWKTWWFWGLIALMVAGILYLLDRERVKRMVSLQKMRTEIALNLHKDVSSTLNNINLLSEMARIKADKDLDRSKEYIRQISDKSNRMIGAMDDLLWSIEPQNDSMQKSLLRMRQLIDELKSRYNAGIVLVTDKLSPRISLDMKKRHEFFLIFKEALRMVIQIAGGRDTLIHLDLVRNKLVLKLQDETANPHAQKELLDEAVKDIHYRSSLIDAETDIQPDQKGIAIIIQLPLN